MNDQYDKNGSKTKCCHATRTASFIQFIQVVVRNRAVPIVIARCLFAGKPLLHLYIYGICVYILRTPTEFSPQVGHR